MQPEFWLQVKNEYVEENFEQLLVYLQQFNLSSNPDDISYKTSGDALYSVSNDYLNMIDNVPVYGDITAIWDDPDKIVRMIAAHLLTSQKRGKNDLRSLARFAHALLLLDKDENTANQLKQIIVNCMLGINVDEYGYTWSSLVNDATSRKQLTTMVCNTSFQSKSIEDHHVYEGTGLLLYQRDKLVITPLNKETYIKDIKKNCKYELCTGDNIVVGPQSFDKVDSINDLIRNRTFAISEYSNYSPGLKQADKSYDIDDFITVVITETTTFSMQAETIKPGYEKIKGNITFDASKYNIPNILFFEQFNVGDQISVQFSGDYKDPFDLNSAFDINYEEYAEENRGIEKRAVFVNTYSIATGVVGHRWITEDGIIVSIKDEVTDDIQYAIENVIPITITVAESRIVNDKFVTNGHYTDFKVDKTQVRNLNFPNNAFRKLISEYKEQGEKYSPEITKETSIPIDKEYCEMLCHALFYVASSTETTIDRYGLLMASQMLAITCNNEKDKDFIDHDIRYLENLIRFAQNNIDVSLSLCHPKNLDHIECVEQKEQIIAKLNEYKLQVPETALEQSLSDDYEAVSDLVDASITLQAKDISKREISRIKKAITQKLKVDDQFKAPEESRTYYGEESDTLEFKSSIVFPSKNKFKNSTSQPHELQKWEILKPVCGFLNSLTGGDLLIGVSDDGYSKSLDDDMDYLYSKHLISEKSTDKLRLYVMYMIDNAFEDETSDIKGQDITTTRINYYIEDTEDGYKIIRIKVSPYEYGTVRFVDERPEDIARSYIRKSGATIKLTDENRKEILKKKLSDSDDNNSRKIIAIQDAIKNHKTVILKNYTSSTSTRDREVEAFELRLKSNAVVCVDLSDNKPKVKEFKISRCSDVEITNKKWKNTTKHRRGLSIDPFGFMESTNPKDQKYDIELFLKNVAANTLKEKYLTKEHSSCVTVNDGSDSSIYPFKFKATVFNLSGPCRFYVGLSDHIKIIESKELKEYIRNYVTDNLTNI